MMDLFDVGMLLTLFLVSISAICMYANDHIEGVHIFPNDTSLSTLTLTAADLNATQNQSNNWVTSAVLAIPGGDWLLTGLNNAKHISDIILNLLTGYGVIIDKILEPFPELVLIGMLFKGILGVIVGYTLLMLALKIIIAVRGGVFGGIF
jgi:hypothetical protein